MKEEIPMTAFEARVKKATDEMEANIKKEEKEPAGLSTAKYFYLYFFIFIFKFYFYFICH